MKKFYMHYTLETAEPAAKTAAPTPSEIRVESATPKSPDRPRAA